MGTMTVKELKERVDGENPPVLVDVREAMERDIAVLANDIHIPMNHIPARLSDLDPKKETVIYCRSGARSAQVVQYLSQNGFTNVKNLVGGILAWADQIDPDMSKY